MKIFTNPYAELEYPDSLKRVVPNKEIYGLKPLLFCPDEDCPDKSRRLFIKKRTSFTGITYFFSHYPCKISPDCSFDHNFNPETLLHKEAILWFKDRDEFKVRGHGYKTHVLKTQTIKIDPSKTVTEWNGLKRIRPDVKIVDLVGYRIAIEIYVNHKVDEDKLKRIKGYGLPTIEIDLHDEYLCNKKKYKDRDYVIKKLDSLLTDPSLQKWIVPPSIDDANKYFEIEEVLQENAEEPIPIESKEAIETNNDSSNDNLTTGLILTIAAGIIAFLGFKKMKPKRKPRNKRRKV